MVVRVLLVLAALAVLYGCGQASSPAEKQGGAPTQPCEGFHPDAVRNGKIAFVKLDQDIYVMNPDGTGERNLTNTSTVQETVAAWSPDGEKIAFTATDSTADDLYVMNADGSGRTKLADTSGVSEESLAWSPDCGKIAFEGGTEGNIGGNPNDIYVMNADGTGRMRLSDTRVGETNPTWSPDGEKIAFLLGEEKGSSCAICVINADGTGRRCVADGVYPAGAGVAWGSG